MKKYGKGDQFVFGLAAGLLAGLVGGVVLVMSQASALEPGAATFALNRLEQGLDWASDNLGLSLPVFAVVLILFGVSLHALRQRIREARPLDEVAQADHLTDTWTSLFFGVGVIWTAIGMRGALLYALGDPESTAQDGAFAVLQRMVNGGILVALSTTIFGGIGGYVMRVVKTLVVGAPLKRYYDGVSQQSAQGIQSTLNAMERHLANLAEETPTEEALRHERPALD